MLELVHIEYWSGKSQKSLVVLSIGVDRTGQLVGLKSDKLSRSDVQKVKQHKDRLVGMDIRDLQSWLDRNLQNYHSALCKLKKGRYSIRESYSI